VNISKLLANKVSIIDNISLNSCNDIAINKTNIARIPPSLTISSLCFLQPNVKAINEVGKIKYMSVSWNSCDVKNASSIYGDKIIKIGSNIQCIAHTADTVIPKLSSIFCIVVKRIMHN
jgi:hypothetical protein